MRNAESADTIAALASGHGRSPAGIVRLSGPATGATLARCLVKAPAAPGAAPARLRVGSAELPVLVIRFLAPRSYTGEDAAEILLPGNPTLLDRVLRDLLACDGVREAQPGEFTARAYFAGRLTLAQAEGAAAMIAAATDAELGAARSLRTGERGVRYRDWLDRLATLLALVEAGVDFSDQEDVTPIAPFDLHARLGELDLELTATLGGTRGIEASVAMPEVVLAGRPSAGKSTLFNALLGRRRAVTSDTPGTTRDVLREPFMPDERLGLEVMLTDVAGIDGQAQSPVEQEASRRAGDAIAAARVVVWCDPAGSFDARLPGADGREGAIIRVRTKADLLGRGPAAATGLPVCALDGYGLEALRLEIARAAWGAGLGGGDLLLPRHRRALLAARQHVAAARGLVDPGGRTLARPELVADQLREAVDAAGELLGRMDPDAIIGRIFATFCVGK